MNIVLGAGIAGLSAANELRNNGLKSLILEKNKTWGGLLDNFTIDGFRFDKFIHLSFSQDDYVNSIFQQTPFLKHNPLSYNYYNGYWLKHPAQNNLYPLSNEEKLLILRDFSTRREIDPDNINDYETWLRVQFGDYFSEKFPMIYTEKYWTLEAKDLETKWVGARMYKPSLEEIEKGCLTDETPNTYYAKEMRYPKKGGYKSFLNPLAAGLDIHTESKIAKINLKDKLVHTENKRQYNFSQLLSSLPLPEICNLIENIPDEILKASQKLNFTSGYLISLGFNKPDIADKLWFYIYDKNILPSRVYSPSMKSIDNVPQGCSSLQAEIYFNKGKKIDIDDEELLNNTISQFIEMGLFKIEDLIVKDIRTEKYANVIFDHNIYTNRQIVLDYLEKNNIISIGRFGEWEYFWSDQSMLSGINGARKIIEDKTYD
jgi:protoporphyrinogen oxidase